MWQHPKEDEIRKPKMWNGKPWYYCHSDTGGKCDGAYRRHKPDQCEGKSSKDNKNFKKKDTNPKKLKPTKALQAVIEKHNGSDESD